jgi:hypothetical protein
MPPRSHADEGYARGGVFQSLRDVHHEGPKPERIMIDATHLKALRAVASLLKKGLFPVVLEGQKAD